MRTSKLFLMAATIVLLAGLYGGAMAQGRKAQAGPIAQLSPPEPIGSVVKVNAIEITDGTLGLENQTLKETAFGYAFFGRTSGAFPGSFTLSMNCAPATKNPGAGNEVTGGSWTLPVYMPEVRTGYAGSLYGTIAKGSMNWDENGLSANVYIVLNVDGGTQVWNGARGYATFVGTLIVDEKTDRTTLSGDMIFTFLSGVKQ